MPKQLFTVPVAATGGNFTCTTATDDNDNDNIYLLTFISPPDNRLTTDFIEAFLTSLDILDHEYPRGVLITTSGIQKFFSNGLDLEKALSTPGFYENYLFKLFRRLLTYPMPTVALINGHAFAGGFMIAMYHDYRIQNPSRGYLCMNEIALGVPLPAPMRGIFQEKVKSGPVLRSIVLEGKRFTAQEALEAGIVDGLGGLSEALHLVGERGLLQIVKSPSFVPLKEMTWSQVLDAIDHMVAHDEADEERHRKTEDGLVEGAKRVEQWKSKKQSKL